MRGFKANRLKTRYMRKGQASRTVLLNEPLVLLNQQVLIEEILVLQHSAQPVSTRKKQVQCYQVK